MKKRKRRLVMAAVLIVLIGIGGWYLFLGGQATEANEADGGQAAGVKKRDDGQTESVEVVDNTQPEEGALGYVTEGTEEYRGFLIDNVFHSVSEGDIHYNVYIPESYDGSKPYALYFTLPGYEGLYFQGVAANLQSEEFGFEAQKYNCQIHGSYHCDCCD